MTVPITLQRAFGVLLCAVLLWGAAPDARAQFQNKWLSAGSFHNWYSEIGSECEECGFVRDQQDGWRWPGIYRFTDMQAAKALWIGAQNVTGPEGSTFPVRVVHVGPRVSGGGEFFPTEFRTVSKYPLPVVTVDGNQSFSSAEMVVDEVDPDQVADVMIVNAANTLLGITMERRIMQFSQGFHDNYHVIEYVFTNTGNTDRDAEIELPNQTLEGVTFFFQYRLAPTANSRYAIGNPTGWGKNTMNDTRGDGLMPDPPDEQFRAQYAWHGNFPPFTAYDNLGGPLLPPAVPAINVAAGDTLGRLASAQFAGVVTLHADASAADESDDAGQPTTTTWIHSDAPFTSSNDPFSPGRMQVEYDVMTSGHKSPRHALAVEPTGLPGFLDPTGDPSQGTTGGYSSANGYGPYTLAPGESVRIVMAEGAAGISREAATALGRQFKQAGADANAILSFDVGGQTRSMTKNEWIFTSRDSLFQTFRRAIANYESDFAIPAPPAPPASFAVAGGGDRITLEWESQAGAAEPAGWEIYRAQARFDSTYTLIHTAGPGERTFDDTTPVRGLDYYYYLVAVGDGSGNDGGGMTPAGVPLRSSRYFTQAFLPTQLKRQQGRTLDDIRIVPNPFNITSAGGLRFGGGTATDKLAFFNIPGFARIDIYTELGQLVDTIEHDNGSGDAFWDFTTSSRQTVVSGLYIAVITVTQDIGDLETGEMLFQKGERTIKKFVIIR
ncbi:MAG: hypothetical protein ABJF88_17295 [Rhodothermales bacterium]